MKDKREPRIIVSSVEELGTRSNISKVFVMISLLETNRISFQYSTIMTLSSKLSTPILDIMRNFIGKFWGYSNNGATRPDPTLDPTPIPEPGPDQTRPQTGCSLLQNDVTTLEDV